MCSDKLLHLAKVLDEKGIEYKVRQYPYTDSYNILVVNKNGYYIRASIIPENPGYYVRNTGEAIEGVSLDDLIKMIEEMLA